jgi:hemerythrin
VSYVDASRFVSGPLGFMNADHAEEVHLLERLGEALVAHRSGKGGADAVVERLALLAVRTREHFLREEAAMRQGRYPGYEVHRAEHDRVLAEMDVEVRRFRQRGDVERLWQYLFTTVPAWFQAHTSTLDADAARFLAARPATV